MRLKILAVAGATAIALTMSYTVSYAGFLQPGETMGLSLDSPLPEGVFFADLEDYGRGDAQGPGTANVGVNIPVLLWSTPWTFYNTRLEFLAAFPFAHVDGAVNTVDPITFALGPILAHDFGNGLTGGISAFVRTPTPSTYFQTIDGRTVTEGDFRQSLQYTFQTLGPFNGLTFMENASYTTGFGQTGGGSLGQNDQFAGDFTLEKSFNKFTIGFTGFGNVDTNQINGNFRQASVELGGLVGYDFGKFSLTGIVTRSVYVKGGTLGTSDTVSAGYETRGWVRLIVPLYVAPTAPTVVAKY